MRGSWSISALPCSCLGPIAPSSASSACCFVLVLEALNNWQRRSTAKEIQLWYATLCWHVWIPSLVCLTFLEKEVAEGVGGHLAKKDVFINTKHQEIQKHYIPDTWTNAELKHLRSSQLSNWNASTTKQLKVRTFRCDSQNIMQKWSSAIAMYVNCQQIWTCMSSIIIT